MLSPGAIAACREVLVGDGREFYRESHTRIWRAALALSDRGEPVDAITLTDELEQRGELEDVGGRVRLHELAALVPATANAAHYARIVAEMSERRDLIRGGGELARLGWEGGAIEDVRERRIGILDEIRAGTGLGSAQMLDVESWAEFERSATETIPMLVDGLWPEAGLGILGAPPKKGKTWVALDLAVSVAIGSRFLGAFAIPTAQPVVLVAAEGHRAAIRGRIGALAHGHGIDPQTDETLRRNLQIVYKPAGLNLANPVWIRTIRDLVKQVGARLLIVDVLRAAAVLKENSNDEFRDLFRALAPLQEDGCALALLHHFGKLTEVSKERTPGERLAGAGAIYGAFDVGIFITKSDHGARELRLEFETRDVVAPEPIGVHLDGDPSGPLGGFVFSDAASWTVLEEVPVDDDTKTFINWLEAQPEMSATTEEIAFAFDIAPKTIQRRRPKWVDHGVEYEPSRGGKPARYYLPSWWTDDAAGHVHQQEDVHQETLDLQELDDESCRTGHYRTFEDVHQQETTDLQALSLVDIPDSPTESSPPPADAAVDAHGDSTHRAGTAAADDIDWTQP
jgi:hypothetical protein